MIDWQKIDTILLDLDGTLLDLNYDLHFWLEYVPLIYSKSHNISHKSAKDKIIPILKSEMGKLNWYCPYYWGDRLGLDILKLKIELSHMIQVLPYVEDFLNEARAQNKKIILATNAHRKTINIKMDIANLEGYFDGIISSHDYGAAKQEQRFWSKLTAEIKLNKDSTIFFDDSKDVLESARQFGIKHIVAISKPSSEIASKKVEGFVNIENFNNVLPRI
ncbi:MAG TPA: GMP/IMP nucleotidase [Candidatus Thioglobus sp.]|jgi:putative hydrolase of the HAD superfamily|nr:GMP/IMP nucleotidase [Candidatus Thioglobus sp.]HIL41826.1 GMP/IMP nucleotidase [Gammaproteobacteria bacterium]